MEWSDSEVGFNEEAGKKTDKKEGKTNFLYKVSIDSWKNLEKNRKWARKKCLTIGQKRAKGGNWTSRIQKN